MSRQNYVEIKKEVLTYLESKNLGVISISGLYKVEDLYIAKSKMQQEDYYKHVYSNKLRLYFSKEKYNAHDESILMFAYLYKNSKLGKDYILQNINDLTDGNWKKDIAKLLSIITTTIKEKKEILLNIKNSSLSINQKNLEQIYDIFKNIPKEEQIEFWKTLLNKKKKSLVSNKNGGEINKFLVNHFSREDIKNNFIDISPYINDIFENTVNVDIFNEIEKYQRIISFDPMKVEKCLKISGLNKKKIKIELPKMMKWLSSIMGYKNEILSGHDTIKVILLSNEKIEEERFKDIVQDYLLFVKNNQGNLIENEEMFAKWYAKKTLENKLLPKEVQIKPLKI